MSEHIAELSQAEADKLTWWLRYGTGTLNFRGRIVFEAAGGGGILVRTREYKVPGSGGNGLLKTHFHNGLPGCRTLCGRVAAGLPVTDDRAKVTCGRCRIVSKSLERKSD